MKDDGVHTAFEIILEEIGSVSKELKQESKTLVDKGDYDTVQSLMDTGKKLDSFQIKVRALQNEWTNTFDPTTRSKTHFQPVDIEVPANETLSLIMDYGDAFAEGEYSKKNVRILAGSTVRKETHESLADHIREIRNDAINKGSMVQSEKTELYEVKAPILFGSPSADAQFVAGCSVSGPREWQVKGKGHSLKYWVEKIA